MPLNSPRGIIIAEMLIISVLIGFLVFCDTYSGRVLIGASGAAVISAVMYAGTMRVQKIGHDSGETKTIADLLREHVRLQEVGD